MKTIKILFTLFFVLILSYLFFIVLSIDKQSKKLGYINLELVRPKLFFETNKGQVDDKVKFISNGLGYSLFLMENGAELAFKISDESKNDEWSYIQMRLVGAQKPKQINGCNKMIGKTNYLIGNNKDKWLTNIPNYSEVSYLDVYPGIDLVYYGSDGLLEYDFIVSPNANLNDIALEFLSDKKLKIDKHGNLVFKNRDAEIIIKAPVAYQVIDNKQIAVDARFSKLKKNCVGFEVGDYNKDLKLIIDPKIVFSTFFSNNTRAIANDIAIDSIGNIYITGTNSGVNFPVTDENLRIDYNDGGPDNVFVTKMNSDGTELLYSTYFGGEWEDRPKGIAVDNEGNIIVCGQTFSRDYPLVNAIQTTFRGDEYSYQTNGDAFISKINPDGDEFVYSTYLGGEWDDCAYDVAVDYLGNAFITGWHDDENFPYKNPISIVDCGESSEGAFVAKINSVGGLEFATCLGGGEGFGIALDKNNDVYVTGSAYSDFYTTPGAYRTDGTGAFVQKINGEGTAIIYSTFIYRNAYNDESCRFGEGKTIAVDTLGNAYIAGTVGCDRLTLVNEFQSTGESFVAKLSADGSSLLFSSYFGGTNINEYPGEIDLDDEGDIYVTGITFSSDFPIIDGFQTTLNNTSDAYIAMIDGETYELAFSSYLGGDGWEGGISTKVGIAVSKNGYVHLAGYGTNGFPVENAIQESTTTGDAYVVKLIVKEKGKLKVEPEQLVFPLTEPGQTAKETVKLSNSGTGLLEIKNITVEPSDIYSLEDAPSLPYKLEPEQNVEFKVVYSPLALKSLKKISATDEGALEVESDGEIPKTRISIFAGIVINDSSDVSDADLYDNICDIDLNKAGRQVTLRAAIEHINMMRKNEVTHVTFDIPGWNVPIIQPTSKLPEIKYPISLDASTQIQEYVVIDGSLAGIDAVGITLKGGNSILESLNVMNFGSYGLSIKEKGNNLINNCVIIKNGYSTTTGSGAGILIGASNNKITNNLISGNKNSGIILHHAKSNINNNLIENNKIGTKVSGNVALPNGRDGISISGKASKNVINKNLISGNNQNGVFIYSLHADSNSISNNIIGTNPDSTISLPNGSNGIYISDRVSYHKIDSNTIAGNAGDGIKIESFSSHNQIYRNKIGLVNKSGLTIGNGGHGISLEYVFDNTIESNSIINNAEHGIYIINKRATINTIKRNRIGLGENGYSSEQSLSNAKNGIFIQRSSPLITDNFIYDHNYDGIEIIDGGAKIQFNYIYYNKKGVDISRSSTYYVTELTNTIYKNEIIKNGTGVRVNGAEFTGNAEMTLANINGNFIYNSTDQYTGIHINQAPVTILGNWLFYNDGNAITVDGNNKQRVNLNNITFSSGYGLENQNPVIIVDATNNYWGDSTGPGGSGYGMGDIVSEGVNFTDWKTDYISVYASAERDTIPSPIGQSDSAMMIFDNWARGTDTLNVIISDIYDWIEPYRVRQVRTPFYSDDIATLYFSIPNTTKNNTFNQVKIKAVSLNNPADSIISTFYIQALKPILSYFSIYPDSIEMEANAEAQFNTYANDQMNYTMDIVPNWSCTGGTIDENGFFTAPNENGNFYVIVEDPTSGLNDTAIVSVINAVQVDVETSKAAKKQMLHCYPNPFNSSAIVKYELENPGYVTLSVYNSIGQEVDKLVDGFLPPGTYEINWQPNGLETGAYFCKFEILRDKNRTPVYSEVQKMVYVKLE